jgi:hypothetical protein
MGRRCPRPICRSPPGPRIGSDDGEPARGHSGLCAAQYPPFRSKEAIDGGRRGILPGLCRGICSYRLCHLADHRLARTGGLLSDRRTALDRVVASGFRTSANARRVSFGREAPCDVEAAESGPVTASGDGRCVARTRGLLLVSWVNVLHRLLRTVAGSPQIGVFEDQCAVFCRILLQSVASKRLPRKPARPGRQRWLTAETRSTAGSSRGLCGPVPAFTKVSRWFLPDPFPDLTRRPTRTTVRDRASVRRGDKAASHNLRRRKCPVPS